MYKQKLMYSLGLALAVAACSNSRDGNSRGSISAPSNSATPSLTQNITSSPDVTLRIMQRTPETLSLELRNSSDHPIFVSYVPPERGSATSFLTYILERKIPGDIDFREYDEGLHHVPNLHPINSQRAVTFQLVQYPRDAGEYRVRIAYYEDEDVYTMISERLTEMNDAERKRADEVRKYLLSASFLYSRKEGNK